MSLSPREEFKRYCLYNCGAPVLQNPTDDDQVEYRIDEALSYFHEFSEEGTELAYFAYPSITEDDINNKYIILPDNIVSVSKFFNLQDKLSNTTSNIFDMRYQLRLNELWDFTSASFLNYQVTMQHLETLNILFTGEIPYEFKHHKLYVFWGWGQVEAPLGSNIVIECYRTIDPDENPHVYENRWLRKYATALIKRMIGTNLSRYDSMLLPGGNRINGVRGLEAAEREIEKLELECQNTYSRPLGFLMG